MDEPTTMRPCSWCEGPIPAGVRSDSVFCSKRCRQASWRFRQGAPRDRAPSDRPMSFAYADPPYPGTADRYYSDHPDFAGEVDHADLVERLVAGWPHGWALSTSASALPDVLAVCPREVRVAAWHRGERPTSSYEALNAWEPVIVFRGRRYLSPPQERRVDSLVWTSRPRLSDPARVVGAKPPRFAYWLFDLLGARPGDRLADLFPGSGAIARAWDVFGGVVEDLVDGSASPGRRDVSWPTSAATRPVAPARRVGSPAPLGADGQPICVCTHELPCELHVPQVRDAIEMTSSYGGPFRSFVMGRARPDPHLELGPMTEA